MQVNPILVTSLAVTVLVDILAPLALAIFLARRYRGRWRYWLYGLLVFLLSQGITRVPAMIYFQTRTAVAEALKEPVWYWSFLLFAAVTAGLFEEGGRWLAFRWLIPPAERHWRTALMLGAGHGGLESIAIGLVALAGLATYLAITLLPPASLAGYGAQIEAAKKQFVDLQGWEPLLGGWERLGALVIQLALTVLVLQAFVRGPRWWWYALGAHALVDFSTVALLHQAREVWGWGLRPAALATEGLVTVYALAGFWLIAVLRPGEGEKVGAAGERSTGDPLS
jgi:uncharacterized membrane protein YhfC